MKVLLNDLFISVLQRVLMRWYRIGDFNNLRVLIILKDKKS